MEISQSYDSLAFVNREILSIIAAKTPVAYKKDTRNRVPLNISISLCLIRVKYPKSPSQLCIVTTVVGAGRRHATVWPDCACGGICVEMTFYRRVKMFRFHHESRCFIHGDINESWSIWPASMGPHLSQKKVLLMLCKGWRGFSHRFPSTQH